MKCIILLTLVALCYSYPYGTGVGKSVIINDDGTIVMTGAGGKRILINKGIGSSGQSLDEGQLEQEWNWGRQQGVSGQNQVSVLDLLREQAIEHELQQQAQLSQVGQPSQVAVNVPIGVDEQGRRVVETVVVPRSQVTTGLGQWGLSDTRGLWGNQQLGGITGISRTPWGARGLLTAGQLGQSRWGQVGGINEPMSAILEEVIEAEREILNQQRQIQQQQLQQQQKVLVQQLIQQKEQQQQQLQQQLMQQLQQQQLQQQEALLEQQRQQLTGGNSLLQGGWPSIQTRGQLSLWQQQPGAPSQGGLVGGYGQNIPVIRRTGVPFIL